MLVIKSYDGEPCFRTVFKYFFKKEQLENISSCPNYLTVTKQPLFITTHH